MVNKRIIWEWSGQFIKACRTIVLTFLLIYLCSCSKRINIYCGSGFENVKTSITIIKKNDDKVVFVVKDSTLQTNYSTGLSFYKKAQLNFCGNLKIKISVEETKFNSVNDTIINLSKNQIYFDLVFNRADSTFNIISRKIKKGENFY